MVVVDIEAMVPIDVEVRVSIDAELVVSIDVEVRSLVSASSTLLISLDPCCSSSCTIYILVDFISIHRFAAAPKRNLLRKASLMSFQVVRDPGGSFLNQLVASPVRVYGKSLQK